MQRKWLTINGEIIDMTPPQPAPIKRKRRRWSKEDSIELAICVVCIVIAFACGVYAMSITNFLVGIPFHVITVIMAALTWSSFKPKDLR